MEKKIVCEFTKRELEALKKILDTVDGSFLPWEDKLHIKVIRDRIAKIRRDNDPTINSTSSWP